ncbi:thymidine phosphorylase [Mycoplasma iguanae]|uniref:Thymidine phosphorylase n=1 Tax=Mycoplasma iguanae TaxID=292461 RepID=A0ABY5R970_9MOLU|nr:thymidine phosphorylase [Mycoplasma iguanae]UVD81841.1 thymidine phosphorylase [Mycoplasma iguanae]
MTIIDLINKKKNKKELTEQEIKFLIDNYVNDNIKDYQMSAFLMATFINGMTTKETSYLTLAMMHSGKVIDLSLIPGIKVDKHSTGGVGDKTTLVIGPILASLGIPVAKMSGRGLGHTGGTIDKLESIEGFQTELDYETFIKQVQDINIALMGQTDDLVPADKKIYALRDVTGTVDSMPLIASSIMSKKLAVGADAILLDVKCGNGAFMKDLESAMQLGQEMINIGKELNRDVKVEITNMDKPIGCEIGNKNEVLEAIKTLQGQGPKDFTELCYSSCETIIMQSQKASNRDEAKKMIDATIKEGKALEKFYEFIAAQNGNVEKLKSASFWQPKHALEIKATSEGFFNIKSALDFGMVSSKLGAGRFSKTDIIDFDAGITLNKKTNDLVKKGEILFTLYSSKPIDPKIVEDLNDSYEINPEQIENKVILKRME